jgi:hypothetical protein
MTEQLLRLDHGAGRLGRFSFLVWLLYLGLLRNVGRVNLFADPFATTKRSQLGTLRARHADGYREAAGLAWRQRLAPLVAPSSAALILHHGRNKSFSPIVHDN